MHYHYNVIPEMLSIVAVHRGYYENNISVVLGVHQHFRKKWNHFY